MIFNHIIGNSDAHGKNVSFLLLDEGPVLAPFYDLLSTRIYPTLSADRAMSIGGEFAPDAIHRDHWIRMAQEMGVKEKLVLKTMAETSRLVLAASKTLFLEEFREYRSDALYRLQQLIALTAERVGRMAW